MNFLGYSFQQESSEAETNGHFSKYSQTMLSQRKLGSILTILGGYSENKYLYIFVKSC